jgi:3,4-dihydroxy-2-butanone 4-phosphate synthase
MFDPIEAAIKEIRDGKIVIVVDDETVKMKEILLQRQLPLPLRS